MTTDRLRTGLERAWDRAVAMSASDDLPREYVNVLLPLMPEAAEDLLRAHRDSGYGEAFLMLDHAPLLGRHARDLFLERVFAVFLPVSPAELIAEAALGVAPEERGPFRACALPAIANDPRPESRVGAMLAWRKAEPDDVAARITAEAFALLPSVATHALPRLVRFFDDQLRPSDRAALLARLADVPPVEVDASVLFARCTLAAPEARLALANEAVERGAAASRKGPFFGALAASAIVGHAPMLPWFERHLRELDSLGDLGFALSEVGAHLPEALLDLAERRLRELDEETWRKAQVLAELSRHHATRREALRAELRELVERAVGDPVLGHRMTPDEYCALDNMDALRATLAMDVSAAFEGDERRALQLRALAIVERADTGVEHHDDFEGPHWGDLGAVLHPSLRAEAVRVALAMGHRPTALKAVGEMVAAFPEGSRHLALLGLSRLADGAAPQRLPRALDALEAAANARTRAPARRAKADRAAAPWTDADESALACFKDFVARDDWFGEDQAHPVCERLTPEAARRAAALALSMELTHKRRDVAAALSALASLAGTVEREALVADLLAPRGRSAPLAYEVRAIARSLLAVCDEGDAAWAGRVASFVEGHTWDAEAFLEAVEALAPVLRRLGGPELARGLASKLRAPLPTTELARPWAHSPVGDFDA